MKGGREHGDGAVGADAAQPREQTALFEIGKQLVEPTAARIVGCSPATFRVRLHRARRKLGAFVTSPDLVTEEVPS